MSNYSSNSKVLRKGHEKALKAIKIHTLNSCEEVAVKLLKDAISDWLNDRDSSNLTGNLVGGFGAAVYLDGEIKNYWNAYEVSNISPPTSGMTTVGETGFDDYDTGEKIQRGTQNPYVMDYAEGKGLFFQDNPSLGDFGYLLTKEWLKGFKPNVKGVTIIVANAVPYADYLRINRKLDILDSINNKGNAPKYIIFALRHLKFDNIVSSIIN